MSNSEIMEKLNAKLEEILVICKDNNWPMISLILSPDIKDGSSVFIGGQNKDLSLMVAEIIANVVEDMKTLMDPKEPVKTVDLLGLFMDEVSEHLEVYLSSDDVEETHEPTIVDAGVALSARIENEIDEKLKSMLVNNTPTKELIDEAKMAVVEILTTYSLNEKIGFKIDIDSKGMVEVSFYTKKRTEGMH